MKKIITRNLAVLNELLKNCKQSDRYVAKIAKVSQPTVTRTRQVLEKTGIIKNYYAIPDYAELGYEFGAVTMVVGPLNLSILSEHSPVAIAPAIAGESDFVLITLHRSMDDYRAFLKKVKGLTVVLFSTQGLEIKPVQVPEKGT